tara:strand:+ start:1918 stop:2265 length:348 start_codon:yes stop_codon:yes gene_type:complete
MARQEFNRKTKAARALHANGICEYCGLKPKKPEYDHFIEAGDGGDNSFENCRFVCDYPCHRSKTTHYVKQRRKHERARDKANGSLKSKQRMGRGNNQHTATRPVSKLYEFVEPRE